METITVEIPEGKEAKWVNGVLTLVDEQPKDITERIKTFKDAYEWCEKNGFKSLCDDYEAFFRTTHDIIAYLKLRIITCALNEGWEPDFWNEDEYKYWPWMNTLTEDEYNLLDDDKQKERCCRVVGRSNNRADAGGLVYAYEGYAATDLNSGDGSRLAFKSGELATYATKQFKEIFADFYFG